MTEDAIKFRRVKKGLIQERFLKNYGKIGTIDKAAKATGIDRTMHFEWMHKDPDYPQRFQEAYEVYNELMESEADRRGITGITEAVYQGGKKVGEKQIYSDTLLIFRMKGRMPDRYKDRVSNEYTGKIEVVASPDDTRL